MQNKLHKTIGNSQPSLRITKFEKSKFSNFQILLFTIFYSLFSIPTIAQPYDWEWALSGGGPLGSKNLESYSQQIYDIKVGTDNNYYFLATISGTYGNVPNGTLLNGQPVKQYNGHADPFRDVFLFSTTCDGTVRWSQAIGGKLQDWAYNLVLDSKNNVYIGATVTVGFHAYSNPQHFHTYFSSTDSISTPGSNRNFFEPYLIKYDKDGNYQGKKSIQDTIGNPNAGMGPVIYDLFMDSNDTIHFIAGLYSGSYLNGNITVPSQYVYTPHPYYTYKTQFHVIKCDTDLNYVSNMVLPIDESSSFQPTTRFAFDEKLNRYYLAGMRSNNLTAQVMPLIYENKPFVVRSFILAINGRDGSEAWRRDIYSQWFNGKPATNNITSLIVDTNSDVYIGGQIWRSYNEQNLKIYDPNNPSNTTYIFTPIPYSNLPIVVKFNNSGTVQWVKTPSAFAPNYSSNTQFSTKGLALRGNEVAFGSSDSYFIWDGFSQNNPNFYQPKPNLLRFSKQTGQTIGMHDIKGTPGSPSYMTAVAVDNDGNYVVGGAIKGGLFTNAGNVPILSPVDTNYSFFVAKLAASVCGTAVNIDKFNKLNINFYPNPTTDIVNIQTEETLYYYEVYNVLGQLIKNSMFNGSNKINLHGVTAGTYFIKVATTQGSAATVKVVKK